MLKVTMHWYWFQVLTMRSELFIAALDRVGGQQVVPVVVQPGKCRIDLRIRGIAGSHRLGAGLIDDAGRGPLLVLRVFYSPKQKSGCGFSPGCRVTLT